MVAKQRLQTLPSVLKWHSKPRTREIYESRFESLYTRYNTPRLTTIDQYWQIASTVTLCVCVAAPDFQGQKK